MLWVLGIGIVLWLAVASAGFRRFLVISIGVLLVCVVVLFLWLQQQERSATSQRAAAKLLIPAANIDLIDLRMGTGGPSVTLEGRVRNRDSSHTLTGLELHLKVLECSQPGSCDTVGDETENISVDVPPQQVREFNQYVYFSGLRSNRPSRQWTYDLVSLSGR